MAEFQDQIQKAAEEVRASRRGFLAEKILFVDGLFGCGKTMLSPIVGALDRVELMTFTFEIEYACALDFLGRMTADAAQTLIRMFSDLRLYNAMMSREVNFRPSDLSSMFRSATPLRYLHRIFQAGDEHVPGRIKTERPILHLTTHNTLGISDPLFAALGDRLVLLEVVRHPLYMIKQQTLNMQRLHGDARDFTIYFDFEGQELPFFVRGWEQQYLASNPVERAIYYIKHWGGRTQAVKDRVRTLGACIITVPFERFVIAPEPYLTEITAALGTRVIRRTRSMMKKQRVPRERIAAGLGLRIYQRCGWEPPAGSLSEREELVRRRQFAVEGGASPEAFAVLDALSANYEKKYMDGIL